MSPYLLVFVIVLSVVGIILSVLYATGVLWESNTIPENSKTKNEEEEDDEDEEIETSVVYGVEEEEATVEQTPSSPAFIPRKGYDIIWIGGQSNAMGRGNTDLITTTESEIYMMDISNDAYPISSASEPIPVVYNQSVQGSSFAITLARAYLSSIAPNTDQRRVLIINAAADGQNLVNNSEYFDTSSGSTIIRSKNAMTTAMALRIDADPATENKLLGMFWLQGESDAIIGSTVENYAKELRLMVNHLRENMAGASYSTPFIVGTISESWISDNDIHKQFPNRVFRNIKNVLPYSDYADFDFSTFNALDATTFPNLASLYNVGDDLHYGTNALRTMGTLYFNKLIDATNSSKITTLSFDTDLFVHYPLDGSIVGAIQLGADDPVAENTWASDATRGVVLNLKRTDDIQYTVSNGTMPTSFTSAVWVYFNDQNANHILLGDSSMLTASSPTKFLWWIDFNTSGPPKIKHTIGTTTNDQMAQILLPLSGRWHHLALTMHQEGGLITMGSYLNGKRYSYTEFGKDATITEAGSYTGFAGDLYIGGWGGAAQQLNGKMSDLRIYNRALTPEEVMKLYLATNVAIP